MHTNSTVKNFHKRLAPHTMPFRPPASPSRHAKFVRLFERQTFQIDHHSLSNVAHFAVAPLFDSFCASIDPKLVLSADCFGEQ